MSKKLSAAASTNLNIPTHADTRGVTNENKKKPFSGLMEGYVDFGISVVKVVVQWQP